MRLISRKLSSAAVAANTDQVVGAVPIPPGGKLLKVNLEQAVISPVLAALPINKAVMYGCSGWVVPMVDPDAAQSYNNAWDTLVPKEQDATNLALDLDSGTTVTTPESEPGMMDANALFEANVMMPKKFFGRERLLTYAGTGPVVGAAAVDTWTPGEQYVTKMSPNIYCQMHSYGLMGFSSPALSSTGSTIWAVPTEQEWSILQYLEKFLDMMLVDAIGLTETGAETPYEEANQFIAELLEDFVFETTADDFHPQTWTVFTKSTWDIMTPGTPNTDGILTSGGEGV